MARLLLAAAAVQACNCIFEDAARDSRKTAADAPDLLACVLSASGLCTGPVWRIPKIAWRRTVSSGRRFYLSRFHLRCGQTARRFSLARASRTVMSIYVATACAIKTSGPSRMTGFGLRSHTEVN